MISVLLAEDHHLVRSGIKLLLDSELGIQVKAEAANGKEAIRILEEGFAVNFVLTDLDMPVMTGTELIGYMRSNFQNLKIVVLTMSDQDNHLAEAFKAGANGYLLKNVTRDELIFAMKHVMSGGQYICAELSYRIFNKMSIYELQQLDGAGSPNLTKREFEVLNLISEGFTNNEIADKLFTSRRTIEGHRQSLIEKTGVSNSAALITHAFRNGVIR